MIQCKIFSDLSVINIPRTLKLIKSIKIKILIVVKFIINMNSFLKFICNLLVSSMYINISKI